MKFKKIHFTGIKGVGMSALAQIAIEQGSQVTGSDVSETFITDEKLMNLGVTVKNFDAENITEDIDLVVYSASHNGSENIEVVTAKKMGIMVKSLAQSIKLLLIDKKIIAVAGTHGKTTTTSMLALILQQAGLHPSWLIGTSQVDCLPSNAHFDSQGEYAIVEADEYIDDSNARQPKSKMLYLNAFGAIIISTDWDHPDVFATPQKFNNSFKKLMHQIPTDGIIVAQGDNSYLRKYSKGIKAKIKWIMPHKPWVGLKLQVIGQHFYYDATLACAMAHELGVKQPDILSAIYQFTGSKRRLELVANVAGSLLYDDYAHHPKEIEVSLIALKDQYPNLPITLLFQSHTYTRTEKLLKDFVKSLTTVSHLAVAPIFSSARESKSDFIDNDFLLALQKVRPDTEFVSSAMQACEFISRFNFPQLIVIMGAGNIYKWAPDIISLLTSKTT